MIGYICSAVTDFVVTFAEDSDIVNLHGRGHRKLFRYELEQCKYFDAYGRNHADPYLFPVKADRSVSAGRNVCAEYGESISVFRVLLILLSVYFPHV